MGIVSRSFVFYPTWAAYLQGISDPKTRLTLYDIIASYGCTDIIPEVEDQEALRLFQCFIQPQIDLAKANYAKKLQGGQKKKVKDDKIAELASQGLNAKAIAAKLGISVNTVYHSESWLKRNAKK